VGKSQIYKEPEKIKHFLVLLLCGRKGGKENEN
jgi:hypothetical protein